MPHETFCPCCGHNITAQIESAVRIARSKPGKTMTDKKRAASAANMRKAAAAANAAYTPEKRKAAAQKRLATLAAKKTASV